MVKLNDLLNEADSIIAKHASKNEDKSFNDDTIFEETEKMAQLLMADDDEVATPVAETIVETPIEKIAHAIAVLEAVQSVSAGDQLDKFIKTAMDNGHSEEAIEKFLMEKNMGLAGFVTIPEVFLK